MAHMGVPSNSPCLYKSHFITDVLVTVERSAGEQCVQNLLGYLVCGLWYLEVKWLGHVIGLHLTSQGTGKLSSLTADFFFISPPGMLKGLLICY